MKQKSRASRSGGDAPRPCTVALPAELSIEAAAALHARLAPHVADPAQVVLDAAALLRVHTASLQVLAAFFRTRAESGRATAWRQPPATLRASALQLGIASVLGLAPN
ncbi:MAG: STAS domain-containing protein [Gammaproteobacteria bacterium]